VAEASGCCALANAAGNTLISSSVIGLSGKRAKALKYCDISVLSESEKSNWLALRFLCRRRAGQMAGLLQVVNDNNSHKQKQAEI
jgi:hypothetical protein